MNWIRKIIFCISLLIAVVFASQANRSVVEKSEPQKTENSFSAEEFDSLDFIQPQSTYHFVATATKASQSVLTKWFDSLVLLIPHSTTAKISLNFAGQITNRSEIVSLLLYPFHFFW